MSESKFYNQLKSAWKGYIKRIEPRCGINEGIPDCHLVNKNLSDIFIELKFIDKKFKERILPIKKTQFIWHAEYAGKNSFVLFKIENFFYLFPKAKILKLRGKISWLEFVNLTILKTKNIESVVDFLNML